MLEIRDLDIYIQNKIFLKKINLKVEAGHIIRLVAPNGGGKTTLIESILGLRNEFRGVIEKKFSCDDYGYLPQVAHQFPKIYLQLQDICNKEFSFFPKSLFSKGWHTASGGERKKALIAKAISDGQKVIVLDEPFNHLDSISSQQVEQELTHLSSQGAMIIYTGHEYTISAGTDIQVTQWQC